MSKNVNVIAIDRVITFRSDGQQDLKAGEGVPVTATGNPKDKNAQVHGTARRQHWCCIVWMRQICRASRS
jgi:hypothetical protein